MRTLLALVCLSVSLHAQAVYPGAVADRVRLPVAKDGATSSLFGSVSAGATSVTVQSGHGALFVVNGQLYVEPFDPAKKEKRRITAINGDVITFTPALAYAHNGGRSVMMAYGEDQINNLAEETIAVQAALGVDMANVTKRITGSGAPSNPCATAGTLYTDTSGADQYFCPSNNGTWKKHGTGTGGGGSSFGFSSTGTTLALGPCTTSATCNVRVGEKVYRIATTATAGAATGTGTVRVGIDKTNGNRVYGRSTGVTAVANLVDFVDVAAVDSWPSNWIALREVPVTSGTYGTPVVYEAPLAGEYFSFTGSGVASDTYNPATGERVVQISGGGTGGVEPSTTLEETDDFFTGFTTSGLEIGKLGWEQRGANGGTFVRITGEANHPGLVRLSTNTTAGGRVTLTTEAYNWDFPAFPFSMLTEFTVLLRTPATLTDARIRIGILHPIAAEPNGNEKGFYITKLPGESAWRAGCVTSGGFGSETTSAALSGTLSGNTWYAVQIRRVDGANIAVRYATSLGGIASASETTLACAPTGGGAPLVQIDNNATTNNRTLDVDWARIKATVSR